jgi:signal transduction histidine kinase
MTIRQALDGAYGPISNAYRDILKQSLSSNDELQRLAETLLLVASYESNEQSRVREPVDLAVLAPSVLAELRPLWSSKNIDAGYRLEPPGADAIVRGDEGELRRALINLVANALTWTPEGGTVTIVLTVEETKAFVRVEDDGYGVPEAQRAGLFGRLVNRQPRRGAGSGLGLYIARRIVENHGGKVSYAPREPRGSTFTIELPLAVAVSPVGR